ncbi:heme anaerobic degradation radical SAM methyltransferase ChuW/HutW [Aliivibrio sifiae]|uniref:Heme utilization radical SAM enzyme HutW n=1 Tax=Aliivibrio sifiae TaxID=566293 RepID=A0A2S7XJJ5_9GAMM|nr:heme anaerobic degradation radical SAM methyltransferase ChuW/HutW [Aliivibrio sifiae]PQJ93571.1 putative heme utilization radical SAM enzyme HutW [Aliivibrio sifiae]GLR74331.1 putative heme utilization radical SAM enzyme HutW [Aliivibrio sifiae]
MNKQIDLHYLPNSILGENTPEPLLYAFQRKSSAHAGGSAMPISSSQFSKRFNTALSKTVELSEHRCLYVHIPFCRVRCTYCNFFQHASSKTLVADYFEALMVELKWKAQLPWTQSAPFHAVYIGGGTPTDLTADQIEQLGKAIRSYFPLTTDCEITLEGRINRFDEEMFDKALEGGFNRFSFGVQSFNTKVRRSAKRLDDREYVLRRIQELSQSNQAPIVVDLLYGLPYQTTEIWQQDLDDFLETDAHGVDLYQLIEMGGTPMKGMIEKGKLPHPASTEEKAYMYQYGVEFMNKHHLRRLSVNHWAKDNRERSIYNSLTKTTAEVLPVGCGAGGNVGGVGIMQHRTLDAYIESINANKMPIAMMTQLAASAGLFSMIKAGFDRGVLSRQLLRQHSNQDIFDYLMPLFKHWQQNGLVTVNHNYLSLTLAGEFWSVTLAQGVISALSLANEKAA